MDQHSHSHSHDQQHSDQSQHHHHHHHHQHSNHSHDNSPHFGEYYAQSVESGSLPAGITLARMTKFDEAKNILEVGCGSGLLSLYWANILPAGVKYTSVDLSEEMIKIANQRKEHLKNKLNEVDLSFAVGDAQNLSSIPDETIDSYICPLAFCHIPDPIKAFKEALRVLKKGGRIGVSLSSPTKNTITSFLQDCAKKLNIEWHQVTHHKISGREELIKLAQEAGVEIDFCWDQDLVLQTFDENNFIEFLKNTGSGRMFQGPHGEMSEEVVEGLKKAFAENKKQFIPLKINVLFLTGRKPE